MLTAARGQLDALGLTEPPRTVLADSDYWNSDAMDALAARRDHGPHPAETKNRAGTRPGWDGGRYAWMRILLDEPEGRSRYSKRQGMIEPVFADLNFNRRIDRFLRRGRGTHALGSTFRRVVGGR